MPVLTYANLKAAMRHPHQTWQHMKAGSWPSGTHFGSDWISTGVPAAGTTPTTGAVPTSATTGAITITAPSAGTHLWGYVKRMRTTLAGGGQSIAGFMVVDRLSHMGGLSGTTTTAQTVSTAALTRYTSGVGVWMAYEVYTAVGATATTITASYTNTVPTAGQTSQAVVFGGASSDNTRVVQPMCLASGDLGVTSVQNVTVLATTGTAGNFGVTLFQTLTLVPYLTGLPGAAGTDGPEYGVAWFPCQPNACIQVLNWGTGQTANDPNLEIGFIEIPD
jgi:hypothetical protein